MLSQYLHEQVLRDHVEKLGAKIELGTELVGLQQDGEKVNVELVKHDGETKTAERATFSYVIGADGGRSMERSYLFPQ